jgi:hypothetical protein
MWLELMSVTGEKRFGLHKKTPQQITVEELAHTKHDCTAM